MQPIPTGLTPGCLSRPARRLDIIARYAAQGGLVFASHSAQSTSSSLSSAELLPYAVNIAFAMAASTLSRPAAPLSFDAMASTPIASHCSGTVSGHDSYGWYARLPSAPRSGTCISGCLDRSTSMTGRPVFVHAASGSSTPPPPVLAVRFLTAERTLPSSTFELKARAAFSSSAPLSPTAPAPISAADSMSDTSVDTLPSSQRSSRWLILRLILAALKSPRFRRRMHARKIIGTSEFHLRSRTPRSRSTNVFTTRFPTAQRGGK